MSICAPHSTPYSDGSIGGRERNPFPMNIFIRVVSERTKLNKTNVLFLHLSLYPTTSTINFSFLLLHQNSLIFSIILLFNFLLFIIMTGSMDDGYYINYFFNLIYY